MNQFPSPIGVIFFLIDVIPLDSENDYMISVSYRSYILSYYVNIFFYFFCEKDRISVSYRSYILSYVKVMKLKICLIKKISVSYRSYILSYYICMEDGDFYHQEFPSPIGVIFFLIFNLYYFIILECFNISVSYRSYILSYLTKKIKYYTITVSFPSPIGVIFFLIIIKRTLEIK